MGIDTKGVKLLREFVNTGLPTKIQAKTNEIAWYALNKAIDISPVASGQFAASWRISLDPNAGGYAPEGQRSHTGARVEANAVSMPVIARLKFGQKFYLTNTVPHAQYVEYGSPTTEARYITRRVAQAVGGKFGRINL